MSVKHVKEYFKQVCDQYLEMSDDIKEIEEYATTHMVPPEKIDNMKQCLEPIKRNYMCLSYYMFLLNQPNKKDKQKKYFKQRGKKLDELDSSCSKESILSENQENLDTLDTIKEEMKC